MKTKAQALHPMDSCPRASLCAVAVALCAGFALSSLSSLHAQPRTFPTYPDSAPGWDRGMPPPPPPGFHGPGAVQRLAPGEESSGLTRLSGQMVRSTDGQDLSTVTDFLVDPQSGRVYFAMLPSGGSPHGMTYRIIPIGALAADRNNRLSIRLSRAQWDHVGTMEEGQLQNMVTIDADHEQRLSRQLGLPLNQIADVNGPLQLVRASTLRGQVIRAGNGQVGRIDDVMIDVNRHQSTVVLALDRSWGGASQQRYVVPFQRLGHSENGAWMSRLDRGDFPPADQPPPPPPFDDDDARRRADYYAPGVGYQARESMPPPPPPPPPMDEDLPSAVHATREALDHSWARQRVDVEPQGRHLVLRGLLDDERQHQDVLRIVQRTAPGIRIEDQIAVRQ